MSGIVFNLEGPDGAGKTTHALALVRLLQDAGVRAEYLNYPTKGVVGKFVREVFEGHHGKMPSWRVMLHLFMADMFDADPVVKQKIEDGTILISDRSILSSICYQSVSARHDGTFGNLDAAMHGVWSLIPIARMGEGELARTVILQKDVKEHQAQPGADQYEENWEFQRDVRKQYQTLAERFDIDVVNANGSVFETQQQICRSLLRKLDKLASPKEALQSALQIVVDSAGHGS